jgi:exopolyphosphatase / guanosine-5'-triphosphate,3'-diphosphate pyrophosphatase
MGTFISGGQEQTAGLPPRAISLTDVGSDNIKTVGLRFSGLTPEVIFTHSAPAQIGLGTVREDRVIRSRSIAAVKAPLRYVGKETERLGIRENYVVATATVRHAPNQAEFLAAAEHALNRKINVISGELEAMLILYGVQYMDQRLKGNIIAIGGESTAIVTAGSPNPYPSEAFLGSLMLQHYRKMGRNLVEIIDEELERITPSLKDRRNEPLIVTSGLFRATGKVALALMGEFKLSEAFPYGKAFSTKSIRRILESESKFAPGKVDKMLDEERRRRGDSPRLDKVMERIETIDIGRLVLSRMIEFADPSEIIFSNGNLRKGMTYALVNHLDTTSLRSDPLDAERPSSDRRLELVRLASGPEQYRQRVHAAIPA